MFNLRTAVGPVHEARKTKEAAILTLLFVWRDARSPHKSKPE